MKNRIKTFTEVFENKKEDADFYKFLARSTKNADYTINEKTGKIDVVGNVSFMPRTKDFEVITSKYSFGVVTGDFSISYALITSLKGCPDEVGGHFSCRESKLKSLEGAPSKVGESFDCSHNEIETLVGSPKEVGGDFECFGNRLTNLIGAPKTVGGCFDCSSNKLVTLNGAPMMIGNYFDCSNNSLIDIKHLPREIPGYLTLSANTRLTDLSDFDSNVGGYIKLRDKQHLVNVETFRNNTETQSQEIKFKQDDPDNIMEVYFENIGNTKIKSMMSHFISNSMLDDYFRRNPAEICLLDDHQQTKEDVLRRTGIKDLSKLCRSIKSGMI